MFEIATKYIKNIDCYCLAHHRNLPVYSGLYHFPVDEHVNIVAQAVAFFQAEFGAEAAAAGGDR